MAGYSRSFSRGISYGESRSTTCGMSRATTTGISKSTTSDLPNRSETWSESWSHTENVGMADVPRPHHDDPDNGPVQP
jgi:hypothetical protein